MVSKTAPNQRLVAYERVSTARQGQSGLVLEAQRTTIERFADERGAKILARFTEVESGRKTDRSELLRALELARLTGATLVIAKLDRLSRNAAFLLTLRDSGVRFIACDMPEANDLTVGIMALVAEQERQAISRRTIEALAVAKARGVKLGNPNGAAALRRAGKGGAPLRAAVQENADQFAQTLAPVIAEIRATGHTSLRAVAAELNARGIRTRRGSLDCCSGPHHRNDQDALVAKPRVSRHDWQSRLRLMIGNSRKSTGMASAKGECARREMYAFRMTIDENRPQNRSCPLERDFRAAGARGDVAVIVQRWHGIERAVAGRKKRENDFRAGRDAVRRCLEALGEVPREIGRGTAREPLWPPGLSGSITHTAQVAAAAVCRVQPGMPIAIGIDAECVGGIGAAVHETLFTPSERSWLGTLDPEYRASAATCLFSAKEALYKAQFPITRAFVDFPEVSLKAVTPFTPEAGTWRLQNGTAVLEPFAFALFHRRLDGHIFTGCVAQVVAK